MFDNILFVIEYVQTLVNDVWFHLEGFTNDYTMTVLDEIPEDFTDLSLIHI